MSDTAGYDESCTHQWNIQLDMDRPCGAVSSEQTCWLCHDLTAWNRVMTAHGLELEESKPGMLLMRCSLDAEAHSEPVTTAHQASILASWLLFHHPCIQEVIVSCPTSADATAEEPSLKIQLHPASSTATSRRLRGLYISETSSARLDFKYLNAIIGLETLYIDVDEVSHDLAAQINELMERNHATLAKVVIWEAGKTRNRLKKVESLVACECLALKSPLSEGRIPDMDDIVHLMRVSTALKEVTALPIYEVDLSLISKALATNRTLTKLSLDLWSCSSIVELFRSLALNNNLKDLTLGSYVRFSASNTQAVACALVKNTTLKSLCMGVYHCEIGGMQQLSEALSKNFGLRSFSLHYLDIAMSEVSALCKCLRVNKTLKILQLVGADGSDEERTSLAQQLLADDCYDRVRLGPWTEPYLRILSPVLASSRSCTEQIQLPDIGQLSLESVTMLCNALASNKRVKHLIVVVRQERDTRVTLLCEMLKNNRCIERLNIEIENADSAMEILRALTVNAAVSFLNINLRVAANEEIVEAFSNMFSRNKAITDMSMWLHGEEARQFLDSIGEAMSRNRFIVSFLSWVDDRICVPSSILESVRRNKCSLNRAVEFVLQRRDDRSGAECFELFVRRPCMVTQVTEVAGIAHEEAHLKVVAAEHLLQEKFFVFAGIVQHSIVCWPAAVTQIDALNADCWRAISRYLRLTDVSFH